MGQLRGLPGLFLSVTGLNTGYTLEKTAWRVSVEGAEAGEGWEAVAMVQERDWTVTPGSVPSVRLLPPDIALLQEACSSHSVGHTPLLTLLELS